MRSLCKQWYGPASGPWWLDFAAISKSSKNFSALPCAQGRWWYHCTHGISTLESKEYQYRILVGLTHTLKENRQRVLSSLRSASVQRLEFRRAFPSREQQSWPRRNWSVGDGSGLCQPECSWLLSMDVKRSPPHLYSDLGRWEHHPPKPVFDSANLIVGWSKASEDSRGTFGHSKFSSRSWWIHSHNVSL